MLLLPLLKLANQLLRAASLLGNLAPCLANALNRRVLHLLDRALPLQSDLYASWGFCSSGQWSA